MNVTAEEQSGYPCDQCEKGIMRTTIFPKYETAVEGNPFVVENAVVEVCDKCGNWNVMYKELERWHKAYEDFHARDFMSPQEIRSLRGRLGLSAIDFARLLGTTRQSVRNWESPRRQFHQSRMTDSILRLISDSLENRQVDVLEFLCARAAVFGSSLGKKIAKARRAATVSLSVKKVAPEPEAAVRPAVSAGESVAAGSAVGEAPASYGTGSHLLYDMTNMKDCGALTYDATIATVSLVLWSPWNGAFAAELRIDDGWQPAAKVQIRNGKAPLLQGANTAIFDKIRELKLTRLD